MSDSITPDPRYRPDTAGTDPLTVADARELHLALGDLNRKVSDFNDRLAGGQRRWAILSVIMMLVVVSLGGMVGVAVHVKNITTCQAEQNDAFRAASVQSRAAAKVQNDRLAQKIDQELIMLSKVTDPTATVEDRVHAINDYTVAAQAGKSALLAANQTRVDNPIPTGNCS